MKLLVDTHILIWLLTEPERIPSKARAALEDSANEVYVSAAVTWEIGIKHALGKMPMPMAPASYLPSRIAHYGFERLPISIEHTLVAAALPRLHDDPFDRMLVAQAHTEPMTLISVDASVIRYPVDVLST